MELNERAHKWINGKYIIPDSIAQADKIIQDYLVVVEQMAQFNASANKEIDRLRLDITCLKVQVKDRGNSYKEKVRENEELRATLKEVFGCQTNHGTEKLCDGCLISIAGALAE